MLIFERAAVLRKDRHLVVELPIHDKRHLNL
jgi:hypothetical protein